MVAIEIVVCTHFLNGIQMSRFELNLYIVRELIDFSGLSYHDPCHPGRDVACNALYDCYFCRYSPLAGDLLAGNAILPGAGSQPSVNGSGWCLFVYNLAPETEENILWQLFGPFGAVQNVKVIRDLQVVD